MVISVDTFDSIKTEILIMRSVNVKLNARRRKGNHLIFMLILLLLRLVEPFVYLIQ